MPLRGPRPFTFASLAAGLVALLLALAPAAIHAQVGASTDILTGTVTGLMHWKEVGFNPNVSYDLKFTADQAGDEIVKFVADQVKRDQAPNWRYEITPTTIDFY